MIPKEDIKNLKKIDLHVHATAFPEYTPRTETGEMDQRVVSTDRLLEMYDRLLYGTDIVQTTNGHPFIFRDFLEKMLRDGRISEENYRKLARENAIRILKL